ncbi:histidine--tRNA ligase [Marinilactibacillus psychrotolerans]|uniref:Histidine--tRNA ligase n=1 Tax=Marinilactibacillus psychrotolerans TaxID=191770 RepID=A0AAV3WT77_9LACT|nr:histidine--tRNA ligase [Marinilactibacillus psychrotolerans]GEL68063.1 histidine--tRNA ligase [Marinilactibacillus psychrotolerans]GEQ36790.1 histidyl-tRNA synthetase [Marinilactibacillus psychrotolerans]SDD41580.1 histidyl-tRNA synthetase [Marinilactibacillus psychrotolerans]
MNYQKIKGTPDFLPEDTNKWQYIESHARKTLARYQFKEIRTPLFEQFELFSRGVGETSDIVSKEMYDFMDKGNRHIALRPEGTAGVVRAYVENKLYGPEYHKPSKYYYIAPMFRYERPQKGRMRQFHQLGVEVFGSSNPATDVETMALAMDIFKSFNIKNLKLVINSLGNTETRKEYRQALINYLEPHMNELSEDSKNRLYKNPLRVLDSKNKKDKELVAQAPSILDYLDEHSKQNFDAVKKYLEALEINYEIDSNMVRGLDYYNDTIFEIMTEDPNFGSNTTVCAGGRYDSLVEQVGGPSTPGFGFGIGLERLVMLLENSHFDFPEVAALDAFIVTIGNAANKEALKVASILRAAGLNVEREFLNRKPAKQFKTADKLNAKYVFTLGENELNKGTINVKLLETGKETVLSLDKVSKDNIVEYLKEIENSLKD